MLIPTPADLEGAATRKGLSIAEVCKRAGVARSTFTRWKSGDTSPTISVLEKLVQALGADEQKTNPDSEAA